MLHILIKYRIKNIKPINNGFTLLELLLVIAIIAVLSGLVIFNLRPAEILQDTRTTKEKRIAKDLEKAINDYIITNGTPPAVLSALSIGTYDICKFGSVSCPSGSISLDLLVNNGFLSEINQSSDYTSTELTGYKVTVSPTNNYSVEAYKQYTAIVNSIIQDGHILYAGGTGTYTRDSSSTTMTTYNNTSGAGAYQRMYVEWNINTINSNAVIDKLELLYHGNAGPASNTSIKGIMSNRPSTASDSQLYSDTNSGTSYVSAILQNAANQSLDLGDTAKNDFKTKLNSGGWFAISLTSTVSFTNTTLYTAQYSMVNPRPSLRVTYSLAQ
jgi:prepilin-type N-terminal cleavage/methylation domain-containing protein